ncbi:uncharacterized protein LOC120555260 [Perca fluviatilis]|uniref:uncharacterized protein LOC120555260 n=1 Tax=Perca fluviatilis TaxID=8168 RepID=UPI001964E6F3|nr:uncharacterized protein LOC120555260 [Perca fluviatilis]
MSQSQYFSEINDEDFRDIVITDADFGVIDDRGVAYNNQNPAVFTGVIEIEEVMPEERPRANGQPIVLRDVPTVTIETEFRQPVQHMLSRDENAGHPTATLQMTAEIEPAASTENGQEPIQALADSEEEAEEAEGEEEAAEEAEEAGVVVLIAAEDGNEVELNLSEILALERASEQQQREIVEQNITEAISVQTQTQDAEIEPEPVARPVHPTVRFRGRRGIHRVRYVRERPEPVRDAVLRGNRRQQAKPHDISPYDRAAFEEMHSASQEKLHQLRSTHGLHTEVMTEHAWTLMKKTHAGVREFMKKYDPPEPLALEPRL